MGTLSIVFIAIGLSMDSFAVSIANGITIRDLNGKRILLISFSLAFFQAFMPLIGWFAGTGIEKHIKEIDHWVAFGLLFLIGSKMVYEGLKSNGVSEDSELKGITLIGQSLATSIDAFAVGKFFGKKLGKSVEIIGGLVLIVIGIKILLEHTIHS